jgi:GT2 family glycosyltransferase
MTQIGVVIPSRNEGAQLIRTIESLIQGRSSPFPLEIIVVDDNSADGSCDRLAGAIGFAANVSLSVHRLSRWSGIPLARNRGVDVAQSPILMMTDANATYPQGWDLPIRQHFHPTRILAGTVSDELTGALGHGLNLELPSMGVSWLTDAEPFGGYIPVAPCTCTIIGADLFRRLGGYDETLPLYGAAEAEFSVRAWLSGYEIVGLTNLVVAHRFKSPPELSRFQKVNQEILSENSVRFACAYLPEHLLQEVLRFHASAMSNHFYPCLEKVQRDGIWQRRSQLAQIYPRDFSWFAERFGLIAPEAKTEPADEPLGVSLQSARVPHAMLVRTLVIIPTFRQHHLTAALIEDCAREDVDVVVVDNSGDYSATAHEFVLRPGENLGWLRANNLAIEWALRRPDYDRVVLLNNDLRLSEDFFAGLVWTELKSGASIVAASYDGWWKVQRPDEIRDGGELPASEFAAEQDYVPFGACDGTCVSVHRQVFDRVGLLDAEHFGRFGWAAMTDLCFRARTFGMTTAISRAAFCNHLDGGRHTARAVIGADYEMMAEDEGVRGMTSKWGPLWRESRPIATTTPCVVYTAITGARDTLKDPLFVPPGWRFVCFTDSPGMRSNIWDVRPVRWTSPDGDPRRTARWHKINAHLLFPEDEVSIWADASVQATGDWRQLLWYLGSFGLATYEHYMRDCAYSEAAECIRLGLDDPMLIMPQVERYRELGYPEHNGLFETSILLRRHTEPRMIKFAELWWDEIMRGSKRDQISANYAAWRLNLRFGIVRDVLRSSQWLLRKRS